MSVKGLVVLEKVVAVDLEHAFLEFSQLLETFPVERFFSKLIVALVLVVFIVVQLNESVDKVFEFLLDVTWVDISSIQNLGDTTFGR